MAQPDYPTNKAEVLAFIARGWSDLNDLLDQLSDEQLTRPGPNGGWSVKDHMAHLAAWEAGVAALLRREDRWQAMGLSRETVQHSDEEALNALIEANNEGLSLHDVRDRLARVHQELMEALEPLTFEALMQPYKHYDPDSDREDPVGFTIAGNTWHHWAEHAGWIREQTGLT